MNNLTKVLLIFMFLFQIHLLSQQNNITPDELIRLNDAGFEESALQQFISAESLKISIEEIIKLKGAGISEETILTLAIETTEETIDAKESNEIDWEKTTCYDIKLGNELVFEKVKYEDDDLQIREICWSPNDDSLIAYCIYWGGLFTSVENKYTLHNAISGKFLQYLNIDELPSWYTRDNRMLTPNTTTKRRKWGERSDPKVKVYLYFNYDTDYEYEYTSYNIWSPQYEHVKYSFYVDSPPKSNLIFITEDYDEGPGIYALESDPPYDKKLIFSADNKIYNDWPDEHLIRISNSGRKIAVGNQIGYDRSYYDLPWDVVVLDILPR